jgi:hypothetical protein
MRKMRKSERDGERERERQRERDRERMKCWHSTRRGWGFALLSMVLK